MNLYENQTAWRQLETREPAPAITLWSGLAETRPGLPYLKDSIKLGLRALAWREQTRRWIHLLNSYPMFQDIVSGSPRMVHKIYRPYLTTNLSIDGRLAVLTAHYQFISARGLDKLVARAAHAPVTLAQFEGKSGTAYSIALRAAGVMEREGELVLQLMQDEHLLYSVAFSVARRLASLVVHVGCIQGPKGEASLERVRHATRELHGVRPKNLMINLVRQLGYEFGCTHMQLVGNANRAVRHSMRKAQVHADYDQLWREMGAAERADGDFELRCERLPAPDMDEIPSKRRSEVRKRHELHHRIADALRLRLC